MKIILVRHLPTPGNEKRQYIGRTDEELSPEKEELFLGRMRSGEIVYPDVEYVIASPMKRCVRTAKLIWGKKPVTEELLFRECDFGQFEGKTYEQLSGNPCYQAWLESGGRTAFPGGETRMEFSSRCVKGMKDQMKRLAGLGAESAAFVVHGGTIMAVMEAMALEKRDYYDWQTENGNGFCAEADIDDWLKGGGKLRSISRIYGKEIF